MQNTLYAPIIKSIESLNTDSISIDRKPLLDDLTSFIKAKIAADEEININFICTHNSRRSHLSQVWAQTIASYCNIRHVFCYSGGTEATALFPMVAETLTEQGFEINTLSEESNPVYSIKYAKNEHPVICFSKKLDNVFNPQTGFAAVMTCSSADLGCPIVVGAEKRIPITYDDPKAFDNTPLQAAKYKERSIQIATELLYVFSNVNS